METTKKKLHIALFPWLAYGHLMPYLEISKYLAQKGHQIYYISTPANIARLPQHLSSNITFVQLPFPDQIHDLPSGVESTSDIPNTKVPYLKKAFDKLELPLAEFLKASSIKWIIHDFAPYWLPRLATQLGINSVFFGMINATSRVFFGPVSYLLDESVKRDLTTIPEWMDYPCTVAFKRHEILNHRKCLDDVSDRLRIGLVVQGCKFVTLRSCPEFEPDAIPLLGKLYNKPIVPLGFLPPTNAYKRDDVDDEKWESVKKWLDSREEKSVFYVAFGSEVNLSKEFIHELALGIEKSNLPFIWVVKDRPKFEDQVGEQDLIPPGYEQRVRDRGLVLRGWAPQLQILGHSSVGGFLTHCGWSSIIEALSFGRALILFSGASSDHGLNARLMHSKKVGLEIERDELDGSFTSELVSQTIRQVMVEPAGEEVRANAWAMRDIFGDTGMSNKYLDEFAQFIEDFPPSTMEV